jgi:hypothetical protein
MSRLLRIFSCKRKVDLIPLWMNNSKCKIFGLRPSVFDPKFFLSGIAKITPENENLRILVRRRQDNHIRYQV